MADQDLAHKVRAAKEAFNAAVYEAYTNGLDVNMTISEVGHVQRGKPFQRIDVYVSRPL